jgi:hypothetical protein
LSVTAHRSRLKGDSQHASIFVDDVCQLTTLPLQTDWTAMMEDERKCGRVVVWSEMSVVMDAVVGSRRRKARAKPSMAGRPRSAALLDNLFGD